MDAGLVSTNEEAGHWLLKPDEKACWRRPVNSPFRIGVGSRGRQHVKKKKKKKRERERDRDRETERDRERQRETERKWIWEQTARTFPQLGTADLQIKIPSA